jgi:ligand-binding sensor domain-containing protein/signal transduction histidine kinase
LDVWSTSSGLPQSTLTAVTQTRDGYLWVGTWSGLVRFDGVRFSVYDKASAPGLRNSGIQTLLADADGGLWIGTNGGGLSHHRDGVFTTLTTADGLAGDIVRALHKDTQGRLWIGTNGGLSVLEGGKVARSWATRDGLPNAVVRAIAEDRAGVLWIGTNGGGLARFAQGRLTTLGRAEGLPNDFVFALLVDRAGALWVGTNGGGLARYEGGGFTRYGRDSGLAGDVIWSLFEDANGSLWVGTYGGGLYRREGERFAALSAAQGLGSDFVRALAQDHEGSLWIATYNGGLNRLRDGKFTTWTAREGLPSDVARVLLEDRAGDVWVGTSGDGLARFRDGAFTRYGRREGVPHDFVVSLFEDRDGALWVGTNGGGVARLQGGRATVFTTRDGLVDDRISAIAQDHEGRMWFGTNAAGVSILEQGRFTTLSREDGLGADQVMALRADRTGAVWVGTDGGGLVRIRAGRVFTRFTTAGGLGADVVLALHEDADGAMWVGTSGGGLSRVKDGRVETWTSQDGLMDDVVLGLAEDDRGELWLAGNKGVFRVAKADLTGPGARRPLAVTAFGTADGLKSAECLGLGQPTILKDRQGRLWFPTTRGLAVIDPARIPRNPVPPPVIIESLETGRATLVPAGALALPAGRTSWEIRYTALSLLAPEKVRFRYRLEGLDDDQWVDAGTRRSAFFTNVPAGRYVFRVMAANNDGVWNEAGAAIAIELAPRFRETRLFYALVAAGLMLLGASVFGLRALSLEARRRELELQVAERTRDLREQTARTERAREEAERQREIAVDADRLKSELLSIAAHDLRSPLQSVLGYAEMAALKTAAGSEIRDFVSRIHRSADRMLGLVNGLLDSAALESGRVQLRPERLDLAELAHSVVDAQRGAATRKGQDLVLDAAAPAPVEADPERLREVLDNLVSNAVKYAPPLTAIAVRVTREDGRWVFDVTDQGPGLTEDDKARLFGRFQRLSARPTAGEPSSGLGLSIVKQLVELQGGRVWAESDGPGRGSRFAVALPEAPASSAPGATSAERAAPQA